MSISFEKNIRVFMVMRLKARCYKTCLILQMFSVYFVKGGPGIHGY